ncbi:metallophosphoesterase [Aestuariispira insulae]|nr:metallophosphoesterase [Aestuariispira insulae]
MARLIGLDWLGRHFGRRVRLAQHDFQLPRLPQAFRNFRLLHITDPHFDMDPDMAQAIINICNDVEVDLCVFTGDYRAGNDGACESIYPSFRSLIGGVKSRYGFWGILGNHDGTEMLEPLEATGLKILLNESVDLPIKGQILRLTGLDDVNCFYTEQADIALDADQSDFAIALVHSPEMASRAARAGYGLYLCGHTHGGQICLPGGKPLITHLHCEKDLYAGRWQRGDMTGFTSPGAGMSGLPYRFFCQPEVSLITLTGKD